MLIPLGNRAAAIIQTGINNPENRVTVGDVSDEVSSRVDANYSLIIATNKLIFLNTTTRRITSQTERMLDVLEMPTGERGANCLSQDICCCSLC